MGRVKKEKRIVLILLLIAIFLFSFKILLAVPQGAVISNNVTETPSPPSAGSITTPGGSFTKMVLNVTQQNYQWKAYVGNVTGKLTLDDASGYTIYDWTLATVNGEVYASRSNSINWASIACATDTVIQNEETAIGMSDSDIDSITNTFDQTAHRQFYVGTVNIAANTCRAIATYVNDTPQSASQNAIFQEVLLTDGTNLVYTALINNDQQGYDFGIYDFQMIVADNESSTTGNTFYFWVELG